MKQPELEPGTAELTTYLPNQDAPFVIRGEAEALAEMASDLQAQDALEGRQKSQRRNVATTAIQAIVEAPEQLQATYNEPSVRDKVRQYIADAHVRRFDKQHGSNLYGELLAKRREDALFLKAAEIGLLGQDSLYYKRKLGQLSRG